MGAVTAIAWATSTFNVWWGCVKVSEACRSCYALAWDKRTGGNHWGPSARRRFFGAKHWNEPLKWNRLAAASGKPWRVFCSSMADVFEALPAGHPDAIQMMNDRRRLFTLIKSTPALTWLLLTKRPENVAMMVGAGNVLPVNAWIGTTVEDQLSAEDRLPHLLSIDAEVRFVSAEPLLERVDLTRWLAPEALGRSNIDWVITGGESGPNARPFDLQWARSIRDQCAASGAAFFMKQKGSCVVDKGQHVDCIGKGDDFATFPRDLRIQDFPIARAA